MTKGDITHKINDSFFFLSASWSFSLQIMVSCRIPEYVPDELSVVGSIGFCTDPSKITVSQSIFLHTYAITMSLTCFRRIITNYISYSSLLQTSSNDARQKAESYLKVRQNEIKRREKEEGRK